jgi:pimeloyl-ACP methyl ester carboxylesterase
MSTQEETRDVTESAITAGGVELSCVEWPGLRSPLILLHGLGGNAYWWKPLADALPGRRIVAFDLPGHGRSGTLGDWDLERTAVLLLDAAAKVVDGPAIWGGHSWGGKVAALAAGLAPRQVSGLVLIDSAPIQGIPIPPEAFVDGRFAGELGPWPSLQAALDAVRSLPQYRGWSEALKSAFLRGLETRPDGTWSATMSRERAIAIAKQALGVDHSKAVAGVSCPTLLVVAAESVGWQERTNVLAFPSAKREVVAGGHWVHVDNPSGCAAAIRDWLAAS